MTFFRKMKKYFRSENKFVLPDFPQSILLEPTNACNLRCRMCPAYGEGVTKSREIGYMKKDLWTNIINEIGSWPSPVTLDLHGAGEPLLHPNFFNMISHAKSKQNITAGFLCNATLLDPEKAKAVTELGVDWISFSVDGSQREVFEYYRKGADFDVVEDNIKTLLSLRKQGKPLVYFNMVSHAEADIESFIDKWAGLVDALSISIKRPVVRDNNRHVSLQRPCPLLYQQLVVGWPGKTGLCCEDFWGDVITGDCQTESLHSIWHGSVMKKVRTLHEAGKQAQIDMCRSCDTTIFHRYEERIVVKNDRKTVVRRELPELNLDLAVPCPE